MSRKSQFYDNILFTALYGLFKFGRNITICYNFCCTPICLSLNTYIYIYPSFNMYIWVSATVLFDRRQKRVSITVLNIYDSICLCRGQFIVPAIYHPFLRVKWKISFKSSTILPDDCIFYYLTVRQSSRVVRMSRSLTTYQGVSY